ncbi:MAG TPA: hypothetical protein DDZ97_08805 [Deltaproteobacteria bacterium]|jgi:hypothetical protein|nr:hypothetical protein [Deltaproteobacteria bacterium]|tara:strand:+ start:2005 stop:2586 length:582 start_codon:yes stop_codon:yes gene_type:complete
MNFQAHLQGGLVAGSIAVGVALGTGYAEWQSDALQRFLDQPLDFGQPISLLLSLFVTAVFMALFPDLDTTSVPQRWFFRAMFVMLAILYFQNELEVFCLLAFVTLLPVMHKHRGWTHWKVTPWLVALFLAIIWEYFRVQDTWRDRFSWENVWDALHSSWAFVFACVLGHYTHLLLDSRRIRLLPFIRNKPQHH